MDDPVLDRYVLDLTGKLRPRVCFLATASGDDSDYIAKFHAAFTAYGAEPSALTLFYREVADVTEFLASHDLIYVGGGSTVNALAVWKVHGVDTALRAAWESGTVLAGLSAGANCWFEAFTTDSYLTDTAEAAFGLGFLPGSFSPHHSSEPARRPEYLSLIGAGVIPSGYACDDYAAIHFGDSEPKAIASRQGAQAYRVELTDEGAAELPLEMFSL